VSAPGKGSLRAAQGEPVVANEATDGPCDLREFWTEQQLRTSA
jgi:hypothetical protein